MLVICNVSALKKPKEHGFLTGRIKLDPSSVLEYPELNGRWKPNDAVNLCEAGEYNLQDKTQHIFQKAQVDTKQKCSQRLTRFVLF